MAIDLNIDFSELGKIDPNDVSKWPIALKAIVIVILSMGVLGAGYWFDTQDQIAALEVAEKKEQELKGVYKIKQSKAANLEAYRAQMDEMKLSFGAMLRQLPSKTEVAELLVDVSQTGLKNGLEFDLFKPEAEVPAEFYAELPIKVRVSGNYHEFGKFVSDLAELPRIVTLHDFAIKPNKGAIKNGESSLIMEATAKTYRYIEEEE
ncbi:Type IV pilus biogenesis protein PilO [hydrothermal vent metagenome]|uniref:Type IV pilus biogenesis protein PilO n=1 Tax=hydrothermal vent metagenome TaxID=652676 RepID=A0A3B1A540_9ZZZZ